MGGQRRKSAGKKSTGQTCSTTTTTDKDFGTELQQNKVVFTSIDAQAPDDVAEARKFLDRLRESEPPDRLDYKAYLVHTKDYENELSVEISAYPLLAKQTNERVISGYFQRPNHAWSAVDNHLTTASVMHNRILLSLTVRLTTLQLQLRNFLDNLLLPNIMRRCLLMLLNSRVPPAT
ncbi:ad65608c-6b8c-4d06-972d-db91477303d6 [Sclerotinia trifoliorum]|uniref:Ad65608c-6b8c-4d06-972d-db91477303d6 n=1 Tax=Sclerotinia trifoliorum TaxID=28548 RepID=A0A8H2ZMT1_9HELO|nr:ad65608c-6b8c-4d06-972d-db91477303d6 [Sclerotinia trifoliorum]